MSDQLTQHPLLEKVQGDLGGDVQQVAMFQRVGAHEAQHVMSKVSPLAGMFMRSRGKKKAGGLPNMGIFVLTSDSFQAYSTKGGGMNMTVKEEADSWPRAGLSFTTEEKGKKQIVTVQPAGGEPFKVETMMYYEPMMEEIIAAVG